MFRWNAAHHNSLYVQLVSDFGSASDFLHFPIFLGILCVYFRYSIQASFRRFFCVFVCVCVCLKCARAQHFGSEHFSTRLTINMNEIVSSNSASSSHCLHCESRNINVVMQKIRIFIEFIVKKIYSKREEKEEEEKIKNSYRGDSVSESFMQLNNKIISIGFSKGKCKQWL